MMEAVHRYEGYVAQALGDGIFALFGAPIAHEDHAQRALYAALRMQEAIAQYSQRLRAKRGVNLEMRVGVNTGEVVVRAIRTDDLHTDYVPDWACDQPGGPPAKSGHGRGDCGQRADLQAHRGVFYLCKPLGAAQIKGVSEPVPLYQVLGVGPLRTRLQVAARRGLVRFVGRQSELDAAAAGPGAGQGRPGADRRGRWASRGWGSRGCTTSSSSAPRAAAWCWRRFRCRTARRTRICRCWSCSRHYFQLTPQDEARRRREQVTGKLLTLDRSLEDTLPYLLALLGDAEATAQLAQMDPQLRRRRTFEAITGCCCAKACNQPLLLLIEDLHWLDQRDRKAWLRHAERACADGAHPAAGQLSPRVPARLGQ